LGVEIDEAALTKFKMEPPHEFPRPKAILSVVWEGGRVVHYRDMRQCWDDCWAGNQPVQERGVRMEVTPDDGSKEWAERFARLQNTPLRDRR
jgi:hypothetical protein